MSDNYKLVDSVEKMLNAREGKTRLVVNGDIYLEYVYYDEEKERWLTRRVDLKKLELLIMDGSIAVEDLEDD